VNVPGAALHPQQAEMQEWLNKAIAEVREGMAAAKRMLLERCEVREERDGRFSALREPCHAAQRRWPTSFTQSEPGHHDVRFRKRTLDRGRRMKADV
jgi:hypothetical protein